jgi:arylsulfatase A-like enzyme
VKGPIPTVTIQWVGRTPWIRRTNGPNWTAVTKHSTPWVLDAGGITFDNDTWELYDTTKDWSQARDLAKEMPHKLRELSSRENSGE